MTVSKGGAAILASSLEGGQTNAYKIQIHPMEHIPMKTQSG